MKTSARRPLALFALISTAAIARAHPGHDGHEGGVVTWDFSHLAAHPVATVCCVALAGVVAWGVWSFLRQRETSRRE